MVIVRSGVGVNYREGWHLCYLFTMFLDFDFSY